MKWVKVVLIKSIAKKPVEEMKKSIDNEKEIKRGKKGIKIYNKIKNKNIL